MRRTYKYKLYPNTEQHLAMQEMVETHRLLYNYALAQRKSAWDNEGRTVTLYEQSSEIKTLRKENPYFARTNSASCHQTLRRLDRAFQAFFRRVKRGEKPGYPRFQGRRRYSTVVFRADGGGCTFRDGKLNIQFVGKVRIKVHRPIEGEAKTIALKHEADGWYISFSCLLPDSVQEKSVLPAVGIDLGLKHFITTSDGEMVPPPQFFHKAQAKLRRAQRHRDRCKLFSNRHKKAVQRSARIYKHVADQRRDWHHKTALSLVRKYGTIACESLNIKGIARTHLAKSAYDAGWAQFISILKQKAECAAVAVIGVKPAYTSQVCSNCGSLPDTPLTLSDRVYNCNTCGHSKDRDTNAAMNILRLGLSLQESTLAIAGVS